MGSSPISAWAAAKLTSFLSGSAAVAVAAMALASPEAGCQSVDDVLPSDASTDGVGGGDAVVPPDTGAGKDARVGMDTGAVVDGGAGDGTSTVDAFVSTATLAQVRVANWSPDAPPVDFCLAQHGSGDFRGPFVAGLLAAETEAGASSDAAAGGLAYPNASSYALVAPGAYDARIVVGPGCSAKIAPDETALPTLAAGSSLTIALVGDANPAAHTQPLELVGFLDDGPIGGALALRFIHAAPGVPAVDVGTVSGSTFKILFSNIPFGQASTAKTGTPTADGGAPPVDVNGYLSQSALAGAFLRAEAHAASDGGDMANAPSVFAAAGSAVSIVVVGAAAGAPLELLECIDNAGTVGPLSSCSMITQ